jgi:DnaJ family protein C protein 13
LQVGGIYVRLFLKDPKFPLRNPKRFLEGLLDQYLSSIAATHYETQPVDPELPLLLSAALVSLLRVHPALADHVGYLGYVPKLVAAVAYEGRRETMASEEVNNGNYADRRDEPDDGSTQPSQTPQERVRLSCLRVLHQLAASTTCAEAMAATSLGMPQVYVKRFVSLPLKWLSYDSVNLVICNNHIYSFERDGHIIKFAKGICDFFLYQNADPYPVLVSFYTIVN